MATRKNQKKIVEYAARNKAKRSIKHPQRSARESKERREISRIEWIGHGELL